MTTIEQLLEQHDHYDMGDGFTIGKVTGGGWVVYWCGLAVESWSNAESDVTVLPTALAAIRSVVTLRQLGLMDQLKEQYRDRRGREFGT